MMKIYYYNFALYYRGGGGHVYPFYEKQYELFTDKHKEIPFNYTFDKKDLPENLRGDEVFPKEEVKNFLKLLEDSFQIGEEYVQVANRIRRQCSNYLKTYSSLPFM